MIFDTYGSSALSKRQVLCGISVLLKGQKMVHNEPASGCPLTATANEQIRAIQHSAAYKKRQTLTFVDYLQYFFNIYRSYIVTS